MTRTEETTEESRLAQKYSKLLQVRHAANTPYSRDTQTRMHELYRHTRCQYAAYAMHTTLEM
eukprot:2380242-Rhodomonas_salina.2